MFHEAPGQPAPPRRAEERPSWETRGALGLCCRNPRPFLHVQHSRSHNSFASRIFVPDSQMNSTVGLSIQRKTHKLQGHLTEEWTGEPKVSLFSLSERLQSYWLLARATCSDYVHINPRRSFLCLFPASRLTSQEENLPAHADECRLRRVVVTGDLGHAHVFLSVMRQIEHTRRRHGSQRGAAGRRTPRLLQIQLSEAALPGTCVATLSFFRGLQMKVGPPPWTSAPPVFLELPVCGEHAHWKRTTLRTKPPQQRLSARGTRDLI